MVNQEINSTMYNQFVSAVAAITLGLLIPAEGNLSPVLSFFVVALRNSDAGITVYRKWPDARYGGMADYKLETVPSACRSSYGGYQHSDHGERSSVTFYGLRERPAVVV